MVLAEDQVYRLDVLAQIELDLPHHIVEKGTKESTFALHFCKDRYIP